MLDYFSKNDRFLLEANDLTNFDALWELNLTPIDEPNTDRGGWSSVCRLELAMDEGQSKAFYLKRQINHLTRSLRFPRGEPTFYKEFRNIQRYRDLRVPALDALYFGQRKTPEGIKAILITYALDDYRSFDQVLNKWNMLKKEEKQFYLLSIAETIGRLHKNRISHRCFFPKHVFVSEGHPVPIRLIDLEKARRQFFPKSESAKDIETFLRKAGEFSGDERTRFLSHYLKMRGAAESLETLSKRIAARGRKIKHKHRSL